METPTSAPVLSTSFTGYSGDITSTYSTETTWFTGSDSFTTPETIYHVETPTPTSTMMTPHSWLGGNKTLTTGGIIYFTTTTDMVTTFTTYCPNPMTLTTKSQTFTVTQPTTLTITCTNSDVTQILPTSKATPPSWQNTISAQATTVNGASHQGTNTQQNNSGSPTTNGVTHQETNAQQSNGGSAVTFTSLATSTEIVTELTTYCPSPTVLTTNGATYTITEPTTLTITDCPCTLTHTSTIKSAQPTNGPATASFTTTFSPFDTPGFGYTNRTQSPSGQIFNNGSTVLTRPYGGNSSTTATTGLPTSIPFSSSKDGNEMIITQNNTVTANVDASQRAESMGVQTPTPATSNAIVIDATTAFTTVTPSQGSFKRRHYNENAMIPVNVSSNASNSLKSCSLFAILGSLFMLL